MQLFKQLFNIPLLRWKENINAATHWPPYETNNEEKMIVIIKLHVSQLILEEQCAMEIEME